MKDALRAAMVIARRDYVASVWSRTFLLFLIGPLFPILAGLFFGNVGADLDSKATRSTIAILADARTGAAVTHAAEAIRTQLGPDALPDLRIVAPQGDPIAQAEALLTSGTSGISAVISGGLDRPVLVGPRRVLQQDRATLGLLLDATRRQLALDRSGIAAPDAVPLAVHAVDRAVAHDAGARVLTARLGQLILMMLTMILAGMLLSNLIEEKSNKVIEVLAAAVPIDAIFLGKLVAMLGMSLTGLLVWGGLASAALSTLLPPGSLPAPAVGWPMFALLGMVYFMTCYLLLGALFLGIGAQASTVREVQTLSMPVTMGQLGVVALASTAVANPDGGLGTIAAIFPWSSPFTMLARAALSATLWPHLLAILWQALWVALILRFAAKRFRRNVLKSGAPPRWRPFRKNPART